MTNTSATGGYLQPAACYFDSGLRYGSGLSYDSENRDDMDFDRFMQNIVAGITNLPPANVRPRWQPTAPNRPSLETNWVALGVVSSTAETFPVTWHDVITYSAYYGRRYDSGVRYDAAYGETSPHYDTGLHYDTGQVYGVQSSDPFQVSQDVVARHEELDVLVSCYGPAAARYAARIRDGLAVRQNRDLMLQRHMNLISVGDITRVPDLFNEQWYRRVDFTVKIRRLVVHSYPVLTLEAMDGELLTDRPMSIPLSVER